MSAIALSPETLPPIIWQNQPVITTELLAQIYGTATDNIQMNFTRNAVRFIEGIHYFVIKGADLKSFKLQPTLSGLQISNMARKLYLWTERGTVRHAKILDTDNAWAVQDRLEDSYFAKNQPQYGLKQLPEPPTITKAQQGILFNKVVDIAAGRGQIRTQLWSRFQNHFKLNSYKNLPADQFDEALAYLKAKQYEYSNGVEMLYVSNVELDALVSERVKSVQGELIDKEPAVDTQRYLVTIKPNGQHIVPVDLNCFYMTEERFISYLRGNGYLVFKKDQINIGNMVLEHIPYRYLGYMVEVAGKRLSDIQSDKLNP